MSSDSEDEVLAICCGAASAAALLVVSNQVSDMTTTDHMICHAFCSRIQMLIDKDVETVHSIIIKKNDVVVRKYQEGGSCCLQFKFRKSFIQMNVVVVYLC